METIFNGIYVEAFSYPTEDDSKINKALVTVFGKEKKLKTQRIESHHGANIMKIYFESKNPIEIKYILANIANKLSAKELKVVISELDERIDKDGNLHIRVDKQKASAGKLKLSDEGDVVKIRVKVATYPFSLEKVKESVREFLEEESLWCC